MEDHLENRIKTLNDAKIQLASLDISMEIRKDEMDRCVGDMEE